MYDYPLGDTLGEQRRASSELQKRRRFESLATRVGGDSLMTMMHATDGKGTAKPSLQK